MTSMNSSSILDVPLCSALLTSCRTATPFDLLPRGELADQHHLRRKVGGVGTERQGLPLQRLEFCFQFRDALASCSWRHGLVHHAIHLPHQCRDHCLPVEEGDHWHNVDPI